MIVNNGDVLVIFKLQREDLNQALHPMRGKVIDENLEEFQRHMKAIDHGVLLVIGVKRDYRGRGIIWR